MFEKVLTYAFTHMFGVNAGSALYTRLVQNPTLAAAIAGADDAAIEAATDLLTTKVPALIPEVNAVVAATTKK